MITQELTLQSANLNLQAQAWGNPAHTPILALHGWLDNSASFAPLAHALKNYYVLAPDLAGHAHSDHLPANMIYTLETHAMILLSMLEQLPWTSFGIIGH